MSETPPTAVITELSKAGGAFLAIGGLLYILYTGTSSRDDNVTRTLAQVESALAHIHEMNTRMVNILDRNADSAEISARALAQLVKLREEHLRRTEE